MDKGYAYYVHMLKAATWQIPLVFQGTTTFVYDGDGGRVKKIAPDGTQSIYIGSGYEVTKNPDNSTSIIKSVFLGPNRVCETVSGSVYYFHSDHIGSSNVITDSTGHQVACYEYKPYGETSKANGSFSTDIRFTGQRLDNSTSFYFYGARYYDPELGRFIQPDTIVQAPSDPQSFNRYSYCRNNPINYVDPTGHKNIFARFWDWLTGSIGNIVGVIVGAAVAIVSGNLWLGFQAYSITSSVINSAVSGNWGGLAGGIVGGFIGGAFGKIAGVAGGALFADVNTFAAGFATGAIEFGTSGFGTGFGYSLGSGDKIGDAFQAGLISGGVSAAIGGVIQGSYQAGWQDMMHGASMGDVAASKANMLLRGGGSLEGLDSGLRSRKLDPWGLYLHGTDLNSSIGIARDRSLWEGSWVTQPNAVDKITGKMAAFLNPTNYQRFTSITPPKGEYFALTVAPETSIVNRGYAKGGAPQFQVYGHNRVIEVYPNRNL